VGTKAIEFESQRGEPGERTSERASVLGLRQAAPDSWVTLGVGLWMAIGLASIGFWALSGADGRWPAWVWLGIGAPVAAGAALRAAWRVSPGPARWAAVHAGLALVATAALVLSWALTGAGSWLWWPLLGIALAVTVHALLAFADRLPPRPRERVLAARVDQLERTRRRALGVQTAELRRIEQDLHDGAQSRLVALAMLLGRAEGRLEPGSPEAELVGKARAEAGEAVAELRHLARGLAPPLLVERGLAVAIRGFVRRSSLQATVEADLPARLPPECEAAGYFVVAEALTNVLKHAPGCGAAVRLTQAGSRLVVEVDDDGPGGADELGSGLLGMRHRVEALDGTLEVGASARGGASIRAEIPCA
jgi:signal transduction histidine kinase